MASAQAAANVVKRGLDMRVLVLWGVRGLAARCGAWGEWGRGRGGTGWLRRGMLTVARSGTLAVPLLHLQYLQGFRIDLGLEDAALGVRAANFVAAVVDLQPLELPALSGCHLPHGLARVPAIHRRIAIVIGQCGQGGQAQ